MQFTGCTTAIVQCGGRIVIARGGIGAAITAEIACAVIIEGVGIKVAGRVVGAATADFARRSTAIGFQQACAESTGLKQRQHAVGLALGEQVHTRIVRIVHVVLDHVGGVASDIAQGASVVRAV